MLCRVTVMYRNIIFDFDGTLVDSSADIILCLKEAYNKARVPLNIEIQLSVIGPPIREMICQVTPNITETDVENVISEFRLLYDASNYTNTKLYSGVMEVIKLLNENRLNIFIATNKPFRPTMFLLKKFNLDTFKDVVTPDTGNGIDKNMMIKLLIDKWGLVNWETLIVGDGVSDMIAGKMNSIKTAAALYGYTAGDVLRTCECEYYIDSITDLSTVVFS